MECHLAEMTTTYDLDEMTPACWTDGCGLNFLFSSPKEMAAKIPMVADTSAPAEERTNLPGTLEGLSTVHMAPLPDESVAPVELPTVTDHGASNGGPLTENGTGPAPLVAITITSDSNTS